MSSSRRRRRTSTPIRRRFIAASPSTMSTAAGTTGAGTSGSIIGTRRPISSAIDTPWRRRRPRDVIHPRPGRPSVFGKMVRVRAGALGLFAASVAGAGCVVESSAPPPPVVVEPGRLTLRWTVAESVDPNLCVFWDVAAIDVAVSTTAGQSAGEFQAPCTAFTTSISSLYPGNYVADALLIDSVGRARTTHVPIRPFTVIERTELVLDLDFPRDSFLDGRERNAVGGAPPNAPVTGQSAPPADPGASSSDVTPTSSL